MLIGDVGGVQESLCELTAGGSASPTDKTLTAGPSFGTSTRSQSKMSLMCGLALGISSALLAVSPPTLVKGFAASMYSCMPRPFPSMCLHRASRMPGHWSMLVIRRYQPEELIGHVRFGSGQEGDHGPLSHESSCLPVHTCAGKRPSPLLCAF